MIVLPVRDILAFFRSSGILPEAMLLSAALLVLAAYTLYRLSVIDRE